MNHIDYLLQYEINPLTLALLRWECHKYRSLQELHALTEYWLVKTSKGNDSELFNTSCLYDLNEKTNHNKTKWKEKKQDTVLIKVVYQKTVNHKVKKKIESESKIHFNTQFLFLWLGKRISRNFWSVSLVWSFK